MDSGFFALCEACIVYRVTTFAAHSEDYGPIRLNFSNFVLFTDSFKRLLIVLRSIKDILLLFSLKLGVVFSTNRGGKI